MKIKPITGLAIWPSFVARNVRRLDGTQLTYYGTSYDANSYPGDTAGLLQNGDGTCGAWAQFFLDILRIQGFHHVDNMVAFTPLYDKFDTGFIIKNWGFSGSGSSGSGGHPYINRVASLSSYMGAQSYNWLNSPAPEVTYASGVPGQGNSKPASMFNNHGIAAVTVNGVTTYYDPSYGTKHSNTDYFNDEMITGFYYEAASWPANGGTPAVLFRTKPVPATPTDSDIKTSKGFYDGIEAKFYD